jgi:sulfonate transport system ATP-binding protein
MPPRNPEQFSLDLHIPASQFVAIVGKSGCGKSTLLRLINGLEQPSAGRLWLGERPDASASACRIMFQEPRLLPWARVVDNVAVGLGREGSRAERLERARDALDQVGLLDKAGNWPATLSAASVSAWRSRAPWSAARGCLRLMNRSARSTR